MLERNQHNAQCSTGPKTVEGKAQSSQNSLKHGMYAKLALLPTEDCEEYLAYTTALIADMKPVGPLQHEFAQLVIDNLWRLRRFRVIETNRLESLAMRVPSKDNSPQDTAAAGVWAWRQDCDEGHTIETLGRHEQRIANQTQKALSRLKELQREVPQPVQQSGFVPQPAKTQPPTPIQKTPKKPAQPVPTPHSPVMPPENPISTVQKTAA